MNYGIIKFYNVFFYFYFILLKNYLFLDLSIFLFRERANLDEGFTRLGILLGFSTNKRLLQLLIVSLFDSINGKILTL